MTVSYFTPIHKVNPIFINRLYDSLKAQSNPNWQWVIMKNGAAVDADFPFLKDEKIIYGRWASGNIGQLKKEACRIATGEILAEVDYDDSLEPNCTQELLDAFSDPNVDFAYSDCFEYKNGKTAAPYSAYYGWKYERAADGRTITKAKEPSPHSFGWIFYAPNHIRAWRKDFYWKIKGHDEALDCADDHDICCRSYIAGGVKYIPRPLYNYYHTGENTSGQTASDNKNARIQALTAEIHDKYLQQMCLKWAKEKNLLALDFGGRFNCPSGFTSVDLLDADIVMDLQERWPLNDNSVGVLRACHLLEHLSDTIHFFNQAYRVLAPGGFLLIEVPSTKGEGAFSDPTHVKFFNKRSFKYYYSPQLAKYIRPQYTGYFQLNRINEYAWANEPEVSVICCHLVAAKPGYIENHVGPFDWDKAEIASKFPVQNPEQSLIAEV